jgi:hypothetical protein
MLRAPESIMEFISRGAVVFLGGHECVVLQALPWLFGILGRVSADRMPTDAMPSPVPSTALF